MCARCRSARPWKSGFRGWRGTRSRYANRIRVDWETVPGIVIEPGKIPPEVEVKALHSTNTGRLSLHGPGRIDKVELAEFRARRRLQELVFDVAGALTRQYREQNRCEIPANALFPQMAAVVDRYVRKKVRVLPPADLLDLFLAPYYGWLVEALRENIRGDETRGESPELPLLEPHRGPGTTGEVDFWTSREVRQVVKSHVNAVVADTKRWEQSAAYYLDTHPEVESFVKNAGLGLGIPYFWNGEMHEYVPDFIVRLKGGAHLILETKGFDDRKDAKLAAARRWCDAVNAVGGYGTWHYRVADAPEKVGACVAGVG
jgi:type III restriction enzyme